MCWGRTGGRVSRYADLHLRIFPTNLLATIWTETGCESLKVETPLCVYIKFRNSAASAAYNIASIQVDRKSNYTVHPHIFLEITVPVSINQRNS